MNTLSNEIECETSTRKPRRKATRTDRQLKIQALSRILWVADQQIEVLSGHDPRLAQSLRKIRGQIRSRQRELEVAEHKSKKEACANTLSNEIEKGKATHIRTIDEHHKVLIRTIKGQKQRLNLIRVGAGLKSPDPNLDDWWRPAWNEEWQDIDYGPADAVLWPAVAIEEE